MSHHHSLLCLTLAFGSVIALELHATPPPQPEKPEPQVNRGRSTNVKLESKGTFKLNLHRNFVISMQTRSRDGSELIRGLPAVDVTDLDPRQRRDLSSVSLGIPEPPDPNKPEPKPSSFAVWKKKFDSAELQYSNGYASVVDEKMFSTLRRVRGRDAEKLDLSGIEIGQIKLKKYDPVDLVKFLVATGIVDANLHIRAMIAGTHYTSEQGHWFSLHSNDEYWTNQYNRISYDFGIHIDNNGLIRMVNSKHLGRVLVIEDE